MVSSLIRGVNMQDDKESAGFDPEDYEDESNLEELDFDSDDLIEDDEEE